MPNTMNSIDVQSLGKVAVLMGGRSAERAISLMSGEGVLEALRSRGVNAHAFDPADRDLSELKRDAFDRCFIALHGRFGEDGTVQGALELLGIPYTGPGVMASSVGMDKVMTKRIWLSEGISTPGYLQMASRMLQDEEAQVAFAVEAVQQLGLPMIVKAPHEGSSIGVFKVKSVEEVAEAVRKVAAMDNAVLCENLIVGEELTCPILGTGDSARALPLVRIVAPDGDYNYEQKYFTDDVRYLCPCDLPREQEQAIQALALQAYLVLGCRGWSRVDVMVRGSDRQPFLLEINTSPGMTSHSLVPMSAKASGISYPDLCLQILASASLDGSKAVTA